MTTPSGPVAHALLRAVSTLVSTLGLCGLLPASAEIIDRIAVSVGNQAITTSDIDREIRVTTLLNHTPLDFSPTARRATADRMVEQRLILRELENSRYPEPADSEIEPELQQFKKEFANDEEYRRALADRGLTEQDVKRELLWQRRLLLFIDVRFKPGIQVSPQDIQDYFTKVVEPAARLAHPDEPPTLDDYRDKIEEKLIGDQVDKQMNVWLDNARTRDQVTFHPEAFQ
jgi:hypothetical protein